MKLFSSASKLGGFMILVASILFAFINTEKAYDFFQLGVAAFSILILQKTGFEAAKTIFTKGKTEQ